jgi:hypothetical protein
MASQLPGKLHRSSLLVRHCPGGLMEAFELVAHFDGASRWERSRPPNASVWRRFRAPTTARGGRGERRRGMCTGCSPRLLSERAKCLQISVFCVRPPEDLRLVRPVVLLRGLPATAGSLRRFQADSRAGSTRDEKKPAVVMLNTYADLQDFYGSDGTRTRDLRRDRPVRARPTQLASAWNYRLEQAFRTARKRP